MIKKVYRLNGEAINIGEWELQNGTNGEIVNPIPEGATSSNEECVIGWDGGTYTADDPSALRSNT